MNSVGLRARRLLILAAALVVAALLAFPLRGMIHETIVVPAAFLAWTLGLLYRSLSQGVWWWLVVLVVFLMVAFSLVPRTFSRRRITPKARPLVGQVESLAVTLEKARRGSYFKWLVANRLGRLAYQILVQRESGQPRPIFAPLVGNDWAPRPELQAYLEAGLHRSFADFPNVTHPFRPAEATPLDLEIAEAVEFLEVQIVRDRSG